MLAGVVDAVVSFAKRWEPGPSNTAPDCNVLWDDENTYHLHDGSCRLFLLVRRPGRSKPDSVVFKSRSHIVLSAEPTLVEPLQQGFCKESN